MRSYCAVHVDVGYLLASAATYVTGSSLRRSVTVDYPALIARLIEQAEQNSELPMLRVNWYDSGARPGGQPDFIQEEIGQLPRVKLRLGRLSYSGDQKGVDIRIGLDLAIQGQHRVADVVYLVSGDDDLTEAVEIAQSHGVQVVLLAVPDHQGRPHGVSKHLRREVDGMLMIAAETIEAAVRPTAIPDELLPAPAAEAAPEVTEIEEPAPTPSPAVEEVCAEPAAEAKGEPRPAVPSPAVLGRRKATRLYLPGWAGAQDVPFDPEVGVTMEQVDHVAKQVIASWCGSATPEQLAELREDRPTIPTELDRALLRDLSTKTQDAHISDDARQHLRERFWVHLDRVRME